MQANPRAVAVPACPSGEVHLESMASACDDSPSGANGPVREATPCLEATPSIYAGMPSSTISAATASARDAAWHWTKHRKCPVRLGCLVGRSSAQLQGGLSRLFSDISLEKPNQGKDIADFGLPPKLFSTKWLWQAISEFAAENSWRLNACRSFRSVSARFALHVFSPLSFRPTFRVQ
jgi:hypothetical protein